MNILVTTATFDATGFPDNLNVIYNPMGRRLTEEEILKLVLEYQPAGILAGVEPLTRRVLSAAQGLKVVSRCGIGLDSVDLEAAKDLGIKVTNTPDAPTDSVAELTLGLILCLLRRIPLMDANLKQGIWKDPGGLMLKGKTVGVVGCGRIGTAVARLLLAFGCTVIGYDPFLKSHGLIKLMALDDLVAAADIVTLHIPHTEETHHIIDSRRIDRMKPGAMLINAARGGVVDEAPLYEALANGRLAGAALDCFAEEPYAGPLTDLSNVVLTPHVGSAALESRVNMEREAMKNLLANLS